jgi:hypothetical protein
VTTTNSTIAQSNRRIRYWIMLAVSQLRLGEAESTDSASSFAVLRQFPI